LEPGVRGITEPRRYVVERLLDLTEVAVPAKVRRIRHRAADAAAEAGASKRVVDEVTLCVGEAAANAARHAYEDGEGKVRVLVEADADLTVVVRDHGRGMNAARRGLGLRIIHALSQDVSISTEPGRGTELRMRFPLEADDRGRGTGDLGQRAA
jgi:anti-sigma regulatory factor (Ser/Thr protein kinase)